ncbi:hypothetical protein RI367_001026 [Sorochytrium milnesiophthora]
MDIEVKADSGCTPSFILVSSDEAILRYQCRNTSGKSLMLRRRDPAQPKASDTFGYVSRMSPFLGDLEVAFTDSVPSMSAVATAGVAHESTEMSSLAHLATTPLVPPKRRFNVKVSPWWQPGRMYFSVNGHKILFVLQRGVLSPGRFEARLLYPNYPAPDSGEEPVAGKHYTILLTYTERGRQIRLESATVRSILEYRAPAFAETNKSNGVAARAMGKTPMWLDRSTDYTASGLTSDELTHVLLTLSMSFVEAVNGRIVLLCSLIGGAFTFAGFLLRIIVSNKRTL